MKRSFGEKNNRIANTTPKAISERNKFYYNLYYYAFDY